MTYSKMLDYKVPRSQETIVIKNAEMYQDTLCSIPRIPILSNLVSYAIII